MQSAGGAARADEASGQETPQHSEEALKLQAAPWGSATTPSSGWTKIALEELLRRLATRAPVQYHLLTAALQAGGFVSRDAVYKLGRYDEGRTLRGFTRPVTGVCAQLRAEGLLPADAPDALEAVYDSDFSYVQAVPGASRTLEPA